MRLFLRNNGLSLVLFLLFAGSLIGHSISGHRVENEELAMHGEEEISYTSYLGTGAFLESVSENWESEFLQMGMFVILTVMLFQKGSPESKDPENPEPGYVWVRESEAPRLSRLLAPARWVHDHSLSIVLLLLFVVSFVVHVISGAREATEEALSHGEPGVSAGEYLWTAQLWFESLQNWQSEFLSIGMIVVLSIFLRERGSPESKPVERILPAGVERAPAMESASPG
ncbi:MAG: hypothetical protein M3Y37_01395 [Chloroflexota bacterium]|jgi:hypothetical protein|nr:hypothetical protein [Chloroflexota bacterium]